MYFDLYEWFRSYANVVTLGLQGDGTHPATQLDAMGARAIYALLGYEFFPSKIIVQNVLNAIVNTSLLRVPRGDNNGFIDILATAGGGAVAAPPARSVQFRFGALCACRVVRAGIAEMRRISLRNLQAALCGSCAPNPVSGLRFSFSCAREARTAQKRRNCM
jgi:hypothetical protein